jgi:hypothetical protein
MGEATAGGGNVKKRFLMRVWASYLLWGAGALLAGCVFYLAGGFAALIVLWKVFGGAGHPPMPAAPIWLYSAIYFALLPVLSLGFSSWLTWRLRQHFATRRERQLAGTRSE